MQGFDSSFETKAHQLQPVEGERFAVIAYKVSG